jgi:DNA helicase-2/ATP-dependent DNA helicase PcrA
MNNALNWKPDESQQAVIVAHGGYHLVLAPPGCGKTQILTERVRQAHQLGRPYSDMLCLTFTNRAARGMQERISENIADEDVSDLYVGNVHRFCSKFCMRIMWWKPRLPSSMTMTP